MSSMLASPSQSRLSPPKPDGQVHQLYVTHCLYDEGIFRQAGFAPRASSTRDPLLLRFAQEYPSFELPAGMTVGEDSSSRLCRLALVRLPGGQKALIHSVALPAERHGRANDFFSHVLISPTLTPRDALPAWASAEWTTDCASDTAKDLPLLSALPVRGPIDDGALRHFLKEDLPGREQRNGDVEPHVGDYLYDEEEPVSKEAPFYPPRLRHDAERRRELLSLTLRGCLLALRAGAAAPGSRFFILGEPDLVALLLYGAVRLLPPHLTAELTFSTCEPMRHALRPTGLAQVVGIYSGPDGEGIDESVFKGQGWFLDTSTPRCSDELRQENDPAIAEWIDLAVMGEWKIIDKVYSLLGNTGGTIVSFQRGLQAARLAHRLTNGKAEAADLLALKRSPWGPALIEQNRDALWPLVRDASLRDPVVLDEFSDVLAEHVPELEQRLSEALRAVPAGNWQGPFRMLRSVNKGDQARMRETLQRLLPPPPYTPALRFAILRELQESELFPLNQPLPLQSLLRHCTVEELRQFAQPGLPRQWFVWALCYAITKPETQDEAVRLLHGSDDPLLATFWEQFKLLKEESQRRPILAPLLAGSDGKAVLFFSRSLRVLPSLRLETLEWVLETLGAFSREWNDFWCSEDHLARLLDLLRNLGDDARDLWDRLHATIDPVSLLLGDASQRALILNLAAARDRPGLPLPEWAAQTVADWVLLREHFEKASAVTESEHDAVLAACKRRGIDVIAVLRRYFERFVLPREATTALLADFAGFFNTFYPLGTDYQDVGARFLGWMDVVRDCPAMALRKLYSRFYLDHYVPPVFRGRLAQEVLGETLPPDPAATAEIPVVKASAPTVAIPVVVSKTGDTFPLTGVRPVHCGVPALLHGAPWLALDFAAGVVALVLFGMLPLPPRQLGLLCSFLPLVFFTADGTAILHAGVGLAQLRGRSLIKSLLTGTVLALTGGALASGVAFAWGVPRAAVVSVGGAVAGGMLGASVLGLVLPGVLGRLRLAERAPAGVVARVAAATAAMGFYLMVARWLVR
jgi:hypothetical protein